MNHQKRVPVPYPRIPNIPTIHLEAPLTAPLIATTRSSCDRRGAHRRSSGSGRHPRRGWGTAPVSAWDRAGRRRPSQAQDPQGRGAGQPPGRGPRARSRDVPFSDSSYTIEFQTPWSDQSFWLVPRIDDRAALPAEPGRIFCLEELTNLTTLLTSGDLSEEDLRRIVRLKVALGAEILPCAAEPEDPLRPCMNCRGTRFWESTHGVTICAECHPPAEPGLVRV